MVKVQNSVMEGLEACRDSGEHNMFDRHGVIHWLNDNGYYDAALWVLNNKSLYTEGVFTGFEGENNDQ